MKNVIAARCNSSGIRHGEEVAVGVLGENSVFSTISVVCRKIVSSDVEKRLFVEESKSTYRCSRVLRSMLSTGRENV